MQATKGSNKPKGLSGKALKDFRHSVSVLKSKGLVSKRVDARSQRATRYMQTKVRALAPIISGEAIAVIPRKKKGEKAKEFRARRDDILASYRDSGVLDVKYGAIVAPKEFANQRARLSRGMVQMVRPLKEGQEEYVILPFKATTANDLIQRLLNDASLDGLKDEGEYFSFRLYGHNSQQALLNAKEMGEYLQKYEVLNGNNSRDAIKHLTFQRFRGDPVETNVEGSNASPHASTEPKIIHRRADDSGRNTGRRKKERGTYLNQKRENDKIRKQKQRAKESPAEREKRLAKNRIRTAQWKQWKFENN